MDAAYSAVQHDQTVCAKSADMATLLGCRTWATVARIFHQGVSSVGERGHRLSERRPPFLGEEPSISGQGRQPTHLVSTTNDPIIQVRIANLIDIQNGYPMTKSWNE